ncbi:MAG: DUF1294 domain-containing protein, partial [Lentisphaeria bacterium]
MDLGWGNFFQGYYDYLVNDFSRDFLYNFWNVALVRLSVYYLVIFVITYAVLKRDAFCKKERKNRPSRETVLLLFILGGLPCGIISCKKFKNNCSFSGRFYKNYFRVMFLTFFYSFFYWWFLVYIVMITQITYICYREDKNASKNQMWRMSESFLCNLTLFGGAIGSTAAREVLNHKTQNGSFRVKY